MEYNISIKYDRANLTYRPGVLIYIYSRKLYQALLQLYFQIHQSKDVILPYSNGDQKASFVDRIKTPTRN